MLASPDLQHDVQKERCIAHCIVDMANGIKRSEKSVEAAITNSQCSRPSRKTSATIFIFIPCILILTVLFIHQLMH